MTRRFLMVAMFLLPAAASADYILLDQNFDAMGPNGTAAPAGWIAGHLDPLKNRDSTGGEGAATVSEVLLVDNGSGTGGLSGYVYNYGTPGATDRALGNIPRSGRGDHIMQVAITNNTGVDLTSINLSFWGEQWHLGESKAASKPEKLRLFYSAASSTTGFVRMTAFDFIAPQDIPGAA
jgi:hypothetical protein